MYIPLCHHLFPLLNVYIIKLPDQINALTLAEMYRLHNKCFICLFLIELEFEVSHFRGKDPCFREEVVFILEGTKHAHKVSAEIVLACQGIHAWVVVDSLVVLHS